MKSSLFILVFLLARHAGAQPDNPVAVATPEGMWIYLGNDIPKDGYYYAIEKTTGDRVAYKNLGQAKAPQSKEDMLQRIRTYQPRFANLTPLAPPDTDRMWRYTQQSSVTDSLTSQNLPVMHLAVGTGFFDPEVKAGQAYQYKIAYYSSNGSAVRTTESNKATWPARPDLLKPRLKEKRAGRAQLFLQWYVTAQRDLSSFNIFRSVYGKNDFTNVSLTKGYNTNADSIFLVVVDTAGTRAGLFEYFIQPVDIYGNTGPPSDTVANGSVEHAYVPPVNFLKAENTGTRHQVKLHWRLQQKKYLRGITIMRSTVFDSAYTRIAQVPPTDSTYTDIVPQAGENFYYYLVVQGPDGIGAPSTRVSAMYRGNETDKPGPPAAVAAETATNGVTLYWQCDVPYLKGFYVYRSSGGNDPLKQISELIPAGGQTTYTYLDSGRLLSGSEIYDYAIRAVNDDNVASDFSTTVHARPGIKTFIAAPANLVSRTTNGKVLLIWDDLRPAEANLLGYKVYRKTAGEPRYQWLPGDTLTAGKNYFSDSTLTPGSSCQYAVSAIDYFGAESSLSNPVTVSLSRYVPSPPGQVRAVTDAGGVLITWGQLADERIAQFRIYRTQPGGTPQAVGTVDVDASNFLDKTAVKGQLYFYQVTVVDKQGEESARSQEVSIRY